jgi:putative PIG3 family NAD(P)H quinone oxidoreductase
MHAAIITSHGGPEVLKIENLHRPVPTADQVLVQVKASALNRADLLQRQGKYPAPAGAPANIPGMEFAGLVAERGPDAHHWHTGQRVFGITAGGAHAEYVVVHERTLAEVPANLSWSQAAAVPEVFITAHDALWKQAGLRPAENVLIHSVGSGVGLAAVQLCRAMHAIPYGTSRTLDKIHKSRPYGLEDGFQVRDADQLDSLSDYTRSVTDGHGFDVVLDLAGGPYVSASLQSLAPKGRIMCVGTVAGGRAELNLGQVLSKRAHLIGTVLRARSLEEKILVTQAFAKEVVPLLANGVLLPTIDSEFWLNEIQDAHKRLESNETFGKVVLRIAE